MHRQHLVSAAATLALVLITSALAQTPDFRLGSPVPATQAERSIVIGPDTRWANVKADETIRFVIGKRDFGWRFDGHATSIDLTRVAPTGLLSRPLTVYIASTGGRRGN